MFFRLALEGDAGDIKPIEDSKSLEDSLLGCSLMTLGINPNKSIEARLFSRDLYPKIHSIVNALPNIRLLFGLPRGMQFVPRGKWSSKSKESQAMYPAYCETPECGEGGGVLLQILSADGQEGEVLTSNHFHAETTERFYPLFGKAEIWKVNTGWRPLGWREEIKLNERHQLRVREDFAITLIRMEGPYSVRGPDCMKDHHY